MFIFYWNKEHIPHYDEKICHTKQEKLKKIQWNSHFFTNINNQKKTLTSKDSQNKRSIISNIQSVGNITDKPNPNKSNQIESTQKKYGTNQIPLTLQTIF